MSEINLEIGDRVKVNNTYDPHVPADLRSRVVGSVGYVSGKATEQLLWFMPDVPIDEMPNDFGQWAVLNTELDVVED